MKKRLIVVLSGGAIKDEKTGKWRTAKFNEKGDNFGVQGDYLRTIAGSYLYKAKPNSILIASGGWGQLKDIPEAPTLATILKSELIELGVPAGKILTEEKSGATYQQLSELQKIAVKKGIKNIIIISNRYHLPRLRAMIEYGPGLNIFKRMFDGSDIKLKSAEDILIKYKPEKWEKIINKAYKSKDIIARIELEKKGIEQIKKGTYSF